MVTLTKQGDAIRFTFNDCPHYLNDGTIDVPVNSLTLVVDESDMVTFRKSASNDIFVSTLVSEFGMSKAQLIQWFKDNMVGGGGGGVTEEEVQEMIDDATVNYVNDASYDNSTKRINFLHDDEVITYVDATAFIKDGMVDSVAISGNNLVITFNTDAGKEPIAIPLTSFFDPTQYYTKAQVDASLSGKVDSDEWDVKEEVIASALTELYEDKQDKLTAGSGITISGNVISADGGGSVTVDPALDSGSTNPVANSAITAAISAATDGTLKQDLTFSTTCGWGTVESSLDSFDLQITRINIYPTKQISFSDYRSSGKKYWYEIQVKNMTTGTEYNAWYSYTYSTLSRSGGDGRSYITASYSSNRQNFTSAEGYRIVALIRHKKDSDTEEYDKVITYTVNIPSGTSVSDVIAYVSAVNSNLSGLTYRYLYGYQNAQILVSNSGGRVIFSNTIYTPNTSFTAHTNNSTVHITAAERTSWDGAATNATSAVTALGGMSLVKLTQQEYDALATKDANTLYIIV